MAKILSYDIFVAGLLLSCMIYLIMSPRFYRLEDRPLVKFIICVCIFVVVMVLVLFAGNLFL
jgi:hypothetical protein